MPPFSNNPNYEPPGINTAASEGRRQPSRDDISRGTVPTLSVPPEPVDTSNLQIDKDRKPEDWQNALADRPSQFGAQSPGGVGTTALGGFAAGGVQAGMQAQHDRTLRAIAAQQAGARGSQNVGLATRGAQQAMGVAGAELAGQAGRLQMDAATAAATLEQKTFEINKTVEADLQKERDRLIAEYEKMGMSEDQYQAELDAAMERLKAQLTHDYWAKDLEANTALWVTASQEGDTTYLPDSSGTVPGYYSDDPNAPLDDSYWAPPSAAPPDNEPATGPLAAEVDAARATPPPGSGISQEQWDTYSNEQKDRINQSYPSADRSGIGGPEDDPSYDVGGPEDEKEGGLLWDMIQNKAEPAGMEPVGTADQIAEKTASETQSDISDKVDWIGRGINLGANAYALAKAKKQEDRTAIALNIAQSEGVNAAVKAIAERVAGTTPAGAAVQGAANVGVAAAEAAADENKSVSQGDKVAHAAGRAGSATAGSLIGGYAGGLAGGAAGPAAPVAVPILAAAGSTLGGMAGGALHDKFAPDPSVRSTNPQQMVSGSMGTSAPGSLRADPMSLMRPKERALNAAPFEDTMARRIGKGEDRAWDVGGPEDSVPLEEGPPLMPVPSNSSYDFLENISSSNASPPPGPEAGLEAGPESPKSDTMSALGDLHERLKEIESLLGTGKSAGGI